MATKFYLPSSGAAEVTAQAYEASWYGAATGTAKLKAVTTKISSSMVNIDLSDSNNGDRHFYIGMWVSGMIAAQTIGAQTVTISIKMGQTTTSSNMYLHWVIRILDSAGNYRATIPVAFRTDGTALPATASIASRFDTLTSTSVACSDGDRIIIEVGYGGDPTGSNNHNSRGIIGDNAANDLDGADADTGVDNPWVNLGTTTVVFLICPTVTTQAASGITDTGCTGNGTIGSVAAGQATRRGFCYMTGASGDPTTANSVAYDDGTWGAGAYTKGLTGLSANTDYRVRAYTTNLAGTEYGTTVQIHTKAILVVQDSSHVQTAGNVALVQHNHLVVANAAHTQSAGNVAISQYYYLTVANAGHLQAAQGIALTQHSILVVQHAAALQAVDNVVLVDINLVISGAAHLQAVQNVVLIQHSILIVQNASHLHATDNTVLVQHNILAIANVAHLQAVQNVALVTTAILAPANASHLQVTDNVTLVQHAILVVQNAAHEQSATNVAIIHYPHYVLVISNASHLQAVGTIALIQHNMLVVSNSLHLQAVQVIVLAQHNVLTIANALHLQATSNVVLVQHGILVISNASHLQAVDNVDVVLAGALHIANALQAQVADTVHLVQHHLLVVQDASHLQAADNVVVTPHYTAATLAVADSSHLQAANGVILLQHHILNIQNTVHVQVANKVTLPSTVSYVLVVSDCIHLQYTSNVTVTLANLLIYFTLVHNSVLSFEEILEVTRDKGFTVQHTQAYEQGLNHNATVDDVLEVAETFQINFHVERYKL